MCQSIGNHVNPNVGDGGSSVGAGGCGGAGDGSVGDSGGDDGSVDGAVWWWWWWLC